MHTLSSPKIAFIGAGNMAFAIISGLIKQGINPAQLIATNKSNQQRREQLQRLGVAVSQDNRQAVAWADVVILAVKPQMMAEVCAEFADLNLSEKWIISVAAGISVDRLTQLLPTAYTFIRTMPNTPALIGAGVTGLFAKKGTNSTACQFAENLLKSVGQIYWVEQESQMNAIIALTGSSPAYFFRFMEAMQKEAEKLGFSAEDARALVQAVALGSAQLVAANPATPLATLRENVTSKGGTTAKALECFEQYQLDQMVADAMNAAILRACEMEQQL